MRKRISSCSGQSLLEFALLLPLIFLLVVNVVNFGGLLFAYITVTNATRSGSSYMTMGPASAGGPVLPSPATVLAIVTADLSSLPNASSATVNICSNNSGAFEAPETCLSGQADPEPATSVLGSVQVQYTYCPFIPSWDFTALGIHSTLPACTFSGGKITGGGTQINRVAVMRMLQ
jgi:Flp pilus assembly protein TadG